MSSCKILFLESFYGGSHRYFADSLQYHSRHSIELYTLPARHWKWRMRGASIDFVRRVADPRHYDLVFVTSLINVAELKGLWAGRALHDSPIILYMHENQLSYPLSEGEKRDFHYGFTDFLNCLSSDLVLFNSERHRTSFLEALPEFLSHFPDRRPSWGIDAIKEKSLVVYPGVDPPPPYTLPPLSLPLPHISPLLNSPPPLRLQIPGEPPLIVWNHRWEHDKGPEDLFEVLFRLDDKKLPFSLAVVGESFSAQPPVFERAKKRLESHIVRWGYIDDRQEYLDLLSLASIVVSTAYQENFGISVVEAIRAGCRPLLPNRLSYPELIPEKYHNEVLYEGAGIRDGGNDTPETGDTSSLYHRLNTLLREPDSIPMPGLTRSMEVFDWPNRIEEFDELLERRKNGPENS